MQGGLRKGILRMPLRRSDRSRVGMGHGLHVLAGNRSGNWIMEEGAALCVELRDFVI